MTTMPENFHGLEQARAWPQKSFTPKISLGNSGTFNIFADRVWQISEQNNQKGLRGNKVFTSFAHTLTQKRGTIE
ncbi:hypothetical protein PJI16_08415 [Nitrospira sp. MA-1]|nr:hypothetical protein [Nitrospira sp. MA-1]